MWYFLGFLALALIVASAFLYWNQSVQGRKENISLTPEEKRLKYQYLVPFLIATCKYIIMEEDLTR